MDIVILSVEWSEQINGQCLPNSTSSAIPLTKLVLPSFGNHTVTVVGQKWNHSCPRELSVVTSEYVEWAVFYTDGSLIEGSTGFAIHRTGVGGFGYKLSIPAGVFSAELSALFMALRHIREVIQRPETTTRWIRHCSQPISEKSISKHSPGLQKCTLNVLSLYSFPLIVAVYFIFAFCTI
jgi:hypothetical protein